MLRTRSETEINSKIKRKKGVVFRVASNKKRQKRQNKLASRAPSEHNAVVRCAPSATKKKERKISLVSLKARQIVLQSAA